MTIFWDTIMIRAGSVDRAVQAVIEAPEGQSVVNLQELAERAWRAVGKTITVDGVTVKVKASSR